MAVPKRKTSRARRDKRRSSVWKLSAPGMTSAPSAARLFFPTEFAKPAALTAESRSLKSSPLTDVSENGVPKRYAAFCFCLKVFYGYDLLR